jgi:uncharacterized protein YdhG (YjbR/CyaY superfamily)
MTRKTPKSVDAYIAAFPKDVQAKLKKIRASIGKAAPKAEERISYGIPAYIQDGPVIYFAGFANHISIYPAPRSAPEFQDALAAYKGGKGTVQFPLDEKIPFGLITRIVKFRVRGRKERQAVRKR